jgi:non-specific serine/threonine protein kinase
VLGAIAKLAQGRGDRAPARALLEESLVLRRESGDAWLIGGGLFDLGRLAQEEGDLPGAAACYEESAAWLRGAGCTPSLILVLGRWADLALGQGDTRRAAQLLTERLALSWRRRRQDEVADGLAQLATVAAMERRPARAARLFGAAAALAPAGGRDGAPAPAAVGPAGAPAGPGPHRPWLTLLRRQLGPRAFDEAWERGRAAALDRVLAEVLAAGPAGSPPPTGARRAPDEGAATTSGPPRSAGGPGGLTPRQQAVAALIAGGLTNREIAAKLVTSERTAVNHVHHILTRLGLRSRAQVAAWAVEHGLVPARSESPSAASAAARPRPA